MFRDRVFEWSRELSEIGHAWVLLAASVTATRGLMKSALRLRDLQIDSHRVEMSREVSRAYIQPIQGNR